MSGNIPPSNTRPPTFHFEIPNPRHWGPRWESFLRSHGEWWQRQAGPVYWIPSEVIRALARSSNAVSRQHRAANRMIDAASEAAELAFSALCSSYTPITVGCLNGWPIQYPLFQDFQSPLLSSDLVHQLEWCEAVPGESTEEADRRLREMTDRYNHALHQATDRGDVYQRLMAGWAAHITFREDYRAELAAIRTCWESMPDRPNLPIHISTLVYALRPGTAPAGVVPPLGPPIPLGWGESYYQFLRRWQLSHHVTWDLPVPLAPQENLALGVAYHLFGPDWVVPVIPAYAAFPRRADRPEVERTLRHGIAAAVGLPADALEEDLAGHDGADHSPTRRLRMYVVELAVRSRLGQPHGLIERLVVGMAAHFAITQDRIRQYRMSYACFF